ncbi:MAG: HDOD domain-containing protein [Proteobacteria bacterium]|nr:HDOD domain-containing protein [Pseudomonadota bacterium]MBU1650011.1 HDOD domain-containing protein [Pseudomonadota bacterium]
MTNNTHLFARLQDSRNLPSLPQILLQVVEIDQQKDYDVKKLVKIIAQDPSISAKTLRLVNSAYFSLENKLTSLERAVLYLGINVIKNIAITASIHHVFNGVKKNGAFPIDRFWWNSFSCAIFSRRIAEQTKYINVEEAYVAGLLHNLGKLLLWLNFPQEYKTILPLLESQTDECDAERQQIGITHCEAGAWLIRHWKLNSFMADAVLYHHEPLDRIKNGFPLVKITYLAHKFSKLNNENQSSAFAIGHDVLGLDSEQLNAIISGAQEEIENIATSLELRIKTPTCSEDASTEPIDTYSLHLINRVQDSSLLTSFLEDLIQAKDRNSILRTTEQSLNILLEIDTILFFLHDVDNNTLSGCTSSQNRFQELAQDMVLPNEAGSLLAKSMIEQRIINTHELTPTDELSLADSQLLDLIGESGMVYIPMAAGDISVGVIVLGLKESELKGDARLLRLMANQTALSVHLHETREKQAQKIQEERLAATAITAAKIAHEVNNPLAIIKNYFKLFELKFTHSSTLKKDLKILNDEINRISNIVQQLNNFSPSQKKEREQVDLNSLLTDLSKILSKSILYTTKTKIHFIPDPDLPPITASADDIKQIIINLIKNAAEALQEGGNIYLEAHRKDLVNTKIVSDKKLPNVRGMEITIRDDGPGIADEVSANLFDPFISTKETESCGLGLSIVQNMVTQLNGTITWSSSKGQGTSFTIFLPINGFS